MNFGVGGFAGKSSCGAGGRCRTCATRLRWRRWLRRYWRRCRRLGRRFLSGRCLAQMLRDDLACTLRVLTGDLQGEVCQLLRRQPQRTGAEVAARAAIGVRIFQHVREGRHWANLAHDGSRPQKPRHYYPYGAVLVNLSRFRLTRLALPPRLVPGASCAPESGRAERFTGSPRLSVECPAVTQRAPLVRYFWASFPNFHSRKMQS